MLKSTFRNLLRNRTYSLVSIGGLAVGLTAFVLIVLYVNYETGYDQWHPSLKRVYRLGLEQVEKGETEKLVNGSAYPLGTEILENCPEAEAVTRINISSESVLNVDGVSFYEKKIISADSSFFTVFPYRFLYGAAASAMKAPRSVVITREVSQRLFGASDPTGKLISIKRYGESVPYTVSGVIVKSGRSHLDFDFCLSYVNSDPGSWGRSIFTTYIRLKEGVQPEAVTRKTDEIYARGSFLRQLAFSSAPAASSAESWMKEQQITRLHVIYEPVANIHLDPQALGWRGPQSWTPVDDYGPGNKTPVVIFSIAGLLILLLACINYTNLSIAQAGKRARETGIRKVLGSSRQKLIFQFLAEAGAQCALALGVAIGLAALAVRYFNTAFGLQLQLWNVDRLDQNGWLIAQLLGIVLVTSLLCGLYPAFFLSRYQPVTVLRGNTLKGAKGKLLRNGLIVAQFVISVTFLSGMAVVYRQLGYMRDHDPGFNASQVLSLKVANGDLVTPGTPKQRISYLKHQLSSIPGVQSVAIADVYPGEVSNNIQDAYHLGDSAKLTFNAVDFHYFALFGMKFADGRDFSPKYAADSVDAAVLNESAVRLLRLQHPIGQHVRILLRDYRIVGVLKDNLNDGYQTAVSPNIYAIGAERGMLAYDRILVKVKGKNASAAVAAITSFWKTVEPDFPLRYEWVDERFRSLMAKHERLGQLSMAFTAVSLLIAMMGIFALTAFIAEQRKKEISIRKVLGASVSAILTLLSKDFIYLVGMAILIAFPIAWWLTDQWLSEFVYRIEIRWWMFAGSGLAALAAALLTMGGQGWTAAIAKPVKWLRAE